MRAESLIARRLKQVLFRYVRHHVAQTYHVPPNCTHNLQTSSESLCLLDRQPGVPLTSTCGTARCNACPSFTPIQSKEALKQDFLASVQELSSEERTGRYPALAALMWVLETAPSALESEEVGEGEAPTEPAPEPPVVQEEAGVGSEIPPELVVVGFGEPGLRVEFGEPYFEELPPVVGQGEVGEGATPFFQHLRPEPSWWAWFGLGGK